MYRCFNCERWTSQSRWLPEGILVVSGPRDHSVARLCDACIEAIQHCATCGRPLGDFEGLLRLSPASEPLAHEAWPSVRHFLQIPADPYGTHGAVNVEYCYGVRPVNRDLIVADCQACARKRHHVIVAQAQTAFDCCIQ